MPRDQSQESTLRSVVASLSPSNAPSRLELTIVFHPDARRIGTRAILPADSRRKTLLLGRYTPLFPDQQSDSGDGEFGLDDRHVSRSALRLKPTPSGIRIGKCPGACRCRVDGIELDEERAFSIEQLDAGISLFLGHSVVLLLRRNSVDQARNIVPAGSADDGMVGSSTYMGGLREQIERLAARSDDVLVLGETGSGKELVVRALHNKSARSNRPLVAVNMAAITPSLAPALLFGAVRGSFTGASGNTAGFFQQAAGGSLFLDEVGDTPREIQAQLLRAVQQREIQPVGGSLLSVDLRIISATDANLDNPGSGFKDALRYRLAATEITVQPLRCHREDIGELAWHFLQSSCLEQHKNGLLPASASTETDLALWAELFHLLLRHPWPGNIRQLANVIGQVVLASDAEPVLPQKLERELTGWERSPPTTVDSEDKQRPLVVATQVEIDAALLAADYQVAVAAKRLGITRQSVYKHIDHSPQLRLAADIPLAELQQMLNACAGDFAQAALKFKVSRHGLRARLRECRVGPVAGVNM
ncbi:MAG: sigma 54-interacting transcriptional regulator [Halioglobus sp.]